ncbi:MAG: EpsG family protein [Methanothrix sp.]
MVDMEIQEHRRDAKVWHSLEASIQRYWMAFFLILILVPFAGFREIDLGRDTLVYATTIQSIDFSSFSNLDFSDKEPFFYLIVFLSHYLFGDAVRGTFLIYAFLGVTLKITGIYKLSQIPILSAILYICYYYPIHELTMIRIGVASAIFLHAIPDIVNKNLKIYLIKIILATLFHYSVLIALPLYFLHNRINSKWIYVILPVLGILSSAIFSDLLINKIINDLNIFNLIPAIFSQKLLFYLNLLHKGVFTEFNFFSPFYLSWIIIYYFCLMHLSYFKSIYDIVLIKSLGMALFIFYFFSFLPVLSYRLSEICGITTMILLPSIVCIFKKDNKILIIYLVFIYALICLINILFIQSWFNLEVF